MAAVSLAYGPGSAWHQPTISTNAPGGAAAIQLRIADGLSHEELKRLLGELEQYVRANLTSGV